MCYYQVDRVKEDSRLLKVTSVAMTVGGLASSTKGTVAFCKYLYLNDFKWNYLSAMYLETKKYMYIWYIYIYNIQFKQINEQLNFKAVWHYGEIEKESPIGKVFF